MMKSTDSLITKFISYFSNLFNEKFFLNTEKLLLDLTSLTIPTATIIGFFISNSIFKVKLQYAILKNLEIHKNKKFLYLEQIKLLRFLTF